MKKVLCGFFMFFLIMGASNYVWPADVYVESKQEVRTVSYNQSILNNESMFDGFDEHEISTNEYGFEITASKKYAVSVFENIDLVGFDYWADSVSVTYSIQYFESESKIMLSTIIDEGDIRLTDIIPGLVTVNAVGQLDVLFADENEMVWLSDLINNGLISETGWWNSFVNLVSDVVGEIKNLVVKGLRLTATIVVNVVGLNNAAKVLCMYEDSYGYYHADFDCWQSLGGYMDLYDFVFNLGASMIPVKNEFLDENGDGKLDYIIWGWKGEYWELGAGAELGIYRRLGSSEVWYVDKNLAIDMSMVLEYRMYSFNSWTTIIDWNPADYYANDSSKQKQWWLTGFNPNYATKKVTHDQLRVTFDIKFITKGYSSAVDTKLRNAFKSQWVDNMRRWSYNSSSQIFSITF